ncbi:carbonic anhydrase [soil metagenome]
MTLPPDAAVPDEFADLIAANRCYAETHDLSGFDGIAHAGVAIVTCMDSRIDPLRMVGLDPGDAKIIRNPGGRVTELAMEALVLGVHLLQVRRILVVPHTRCAVATTTEAEVRAAITAASGVDASWQQFHVVDDQRRALADDLQRVRTHPLVGDRAIVGGFIYDVDSGLLHPLEDD